MPLLIKHCCITTQDLSNAKQYVQEYLQNKNEVCRFLVGQEKWMQALRESNPEEAKRLEEERMAKLELDPLKGAEIAKEYEDAIIDTTKRLVNLEDLS